MNKPEGNSPSNADKSPVERLSLNRSQCGGCSTKYNTTMMMTSQQYTFSGADSFYLTSEPQFSSLSVMLMTHETQSIASKIHPTTDTNNGKKLKTTIQDDPTASDVYKSLFTSSDKAKNQQKAHWVTFNPQYF